MKRVIVWFGNDLRLHDNAALCAAAESGAELLLLFVLAESRSDAGGASRWWLHHSLRELARSLADLGHELRVERGAPGAILGRLALESGTQAVYWNRRYEPDLLERDEQICRQLRSLGLDAHSHPGHLLFEPQTVANKQGGPFQVFTAFWRHCLARGLPEAGSLSAPVPSLEPLSESRRRCVFEAIAQLGLLSGRPWEKRLAAHWIPGEPDAWVRAQRFCTSTLHGYDKAREHPAEEGTSLLSPSLHFGEITPARLVSMACRRGARGPSSHQGPSLDRFLAELGWRDFAHHLLFHFPRTPEHPLRKAFERFPWAEDPAGHLLHAWQRGLTGYPIVDAGMRQLWATGWMHNRVRMIVASFLVKHLRLHWKHGAAWFRDTLVDADLANNTLGWQWSAGCGADAAPYFRIFNPVLQGRKFDSLGAYVKQWVPELERLPSRFVHSPWEAPAAVLTESGVYLGANYPLPIVEHAKARAEALAAFRSVGTATH